jgi:membrane-associated protease RseP (regulator of RpoE activity)
MRTRRISSRADLLITLSLVATCVTAFAASGKPEEPTRSFNYLLNPGNESWLGLIVQDTNEATAKELHLPDITGVLVVSVVGGSTAEKSGFRQNDVILEFDGQPLRSTAQLQRLVQETPPGHTVSVQINRQGKFQTIEARVGNPGPNALLEATENPKVSIWV